jgi:hypothetical protein
LVFCRNFRNPGRLATAADPSPAAYSSVNIGGSDVLLLLLVSATTTILLLVVRILF